jgi:hypothetical protein
MVDFDFTKSIHALAKEVHKKFAELNPETKLAFTFNLVTKYCQNSKETAHRNLYDKYVIKKTGLEFGFEKETIEEEEKAFDEFVKLYIELFDYDNMNKSNAVSAMFFKNRKYNPTQISKFINELQTLYKNNKTIEEAYNIMRSFVT